MNLDCKTTNVGKEYMGRTSVTASGKMCQAWTAESPHLPDSDIVIQSNFPDASIADASNYCRNPDEGDRPWCYTTDPDERWEYCDVPVCDEGQL